MSKLFISVVCVFVAGIMITSYAIGTTLGYEYQILFLPFGMIAGMLLGIWLADREYHE